MRLLIALLILWPISIAAETTVERVRAWRAAHEQQIVDEFRTLLGMPNVASDAAGIRANADHIMAMLNQAGMQTELLETGEGNPAVFAQRLVEGAETTAMLYIHYDGQPVNPEDWASDPWQPVMRDATVEQGGKIVPMKAPFDPEWRIFARSAGDDKAPIVAVKAALTALDDAGISPTVNLKLFLDGEEEAGSPGLRAMLEKHRDKLAADLWLFCDGPMHPTRRPHLVHGVRGHVGFHVTVYGADRPLHSGHYGNWAPNPIVLLTGLIQSMRDASGKVLVEGFHDEVRPLTDAERAAAVASPRIDEQLIEDLGIAAPESEERLDLAILRPAINLRGIRSGGVGKDSRNAIQTSAIASIGLRLVPDQTPARVRAAVEAHVRGQGFRILDREPTAADRKSGKPLARLEWRHGYPAYRASMDHPMARRISKILNELHDGRLIRTPTLGGSLPIHVIDEVLETPVLILPVANHDNNQHGANENLRLKNLWDAIETYAAVLTGL